MTPTQRARIQLASDMALAAIDLIREDGDYIESFGIAERYEGEVEFYEGKVPTDLRLVIQARLPTAARTVLTGGISGACPSCRKSLRDRGVRCGEH